jgi:muramoyltetrapeptide carboxypeptidase
MRIPPKLVKGDKIALVASARKITSAELENAIEIVRNHGFEPVLGKTINVAKNQFAGNDEFRAKDLQCMLDDPEIKAILFARGGYGSVRIIDKIDFTSFEKNPKWIIGYSDITVFHCHISKNIGVETLHASMPINFANNTDASLKSLFDVLEGNNLSEIILKDNILNREGFAKAQIVGGNLSVIYSLLGSKSFPDLNGKILFLEDLDEYLYHIDRMMIALKRAGVFNNLAGILVGGMTQMNDNEIPFGKTAEEIIRDVVDDFDFPVAFGFPAGHFDDNRTLVMGSEYILDVGKESILTKV